MKKCKSCNTCVVVGLSVRCKRCSKEITQNRRRRLDVMLKVVDQKHVSEFKKLHKAWTKSGYLFDLKPVVVNDKCMTKKDSKGVVVSRKRNDVVMMTVDGVVVKVFDSITQASKDSGDSRVYIKWSSDNRTGIDGRYRWEIKK